MASQDHTAGGLICVVRLGEKGLAVCIWHWLSLGWLHDLSFEVRQIHWQRFERSTNISYTGFYKPQRSESGKAESHLKTMIVLSSLAKCTVIYWICFGPLASCVNFLIADRSWFIVCYIIFLLSVSLFKNSVCVHVCVCRERRETHSP